MAALISISECVCTYGVCAAYLWLSLKVGWGFGWGDRELRARPRRSTAAVNCAVRRYHHHHCGGHRTHPARRLPSVSATPSTHAPATELRSRRQRRPGHLPSHLRGERARPARASPALKGCAVAAGGPAGKPARVSAPAAAAAYPPPHAPARRLPCPFRLACPRRQVHPERLAAGAAAAAPASPQALRRLQPRRPSRRGPGRSSSAAGSRAATGSAAYPTAGRARRRRVRTAAAGGGGV